MSPCVNSLLDVLTKTFLPIRHNFEWAGNDLRFVIFSDLDVLARCPNGRRDFEVGTLLSSSLLAIIFSGNRVVICHIVEATAAELELLRTTPAMQQFCNIVGGDLLEGEFSISLRTAGPQPSELLIHRAASSTSSPQPQSSLPVMQLFPDQGLASLNFTPQRLRRRIGAGVWEDSVGEQVLDSVLPNLQLLFWELIG